MKFLPVSTLTILKIMSYGYCLICLELLYYKLVLCARVGNHLSRALPYLRLGVGSLVRERTLRCRASGGSLTREHTTFGCLFLGSAQPKTPRGHTEAPRKVSPKFTFGKKKFILN